MEKTPIEKLATRMRDRGLHVCRDTGALELFNVDRASGRARPVALVVVHENNDAQRYTVELFSGVVTTLVDENSVLELCSRTAIAESVAWHRATTIVIN